MRLGIRLVKTRLTTSYIWEITSTNMRRACTDGDGSGDMFTNSQERLLTLPRSIDRVHQPNVETRSLYDYRKRHAQYRQDPDTQLSFGKFPWIPVWDDHGALRPVLPFVSIADLDLQRSVTTLTGMVWQIRTTRRTLSSKTTSSLAAIVLHSINER